MSGIAIEFDVRAELAGWIRRLGGMYSNDLRVLTHEQFTTPLMGKARTPQDVTAEVASMNLMLVSVLNDETPQRPSDEEFAAYMTNLGTIEAAIAELSQSCEALAKAVESLSPDQLGVKVMTPWGEEITKYSFASLAASHILYHDGQINLIQSCHGDDQMHWFD